VRPLRYVSEFRLHSRHGFREIDASDIPVPPNRVIQRLHNRYYCLNIEDFEIGDIVLYEANSPVGDGIRGIQKKLKPNSRETRWSHVAIYAGDGFVWDSVMGNGVFGRFFNSSTAGRTIGVRRLTNLPNDFKGRIDNELRRSVGEPYKRGSSTFHVELRSFPSGAAIK